MLEDATDPRPLLDGSLLAVRINSDGDPQLMRHRPGTNSVEPLPVLLVGVLFDRAIKVVPGGRGAVVAGRPEGASAKEDNLYVVDLDTGAMRRIAPDVTLPLFDWAFPLSVTADEAVFRFACRRTASNCCRAAGRVTGCPPDALADPAPSCHRCGPRWHVVSRPGRSADRDSTDGPWNQGRRAFSCLDKL